MKIQNLRKPLLLILFAIIYASCSKEPMITHQDDQLLKFETFSKIEKESVDQSKSSSTNCVRDFKPIEYGYAGVYINSNKNKTLSSTTIQTRNSVKIEAKYLIAQDLDNLPAQITINFEGTEVAFTDVPPGEIVKHEFELPENWQPGDEVSYRIDQKVYLEPLTIDSKFNLLPLCEVTAGENLYGGTVAYIYKEGDDNYVPGENHGYILKIIGSTDPVFGILNNWDEATEIASNYSSDGIDDWKLPSLQQIQEADFIIDTGYLTWTSTEASETSVYVFSKQFSILGIDIALKSSRGITVLLYEF